MSMKPLGHGLETVPISHRLWVVLIALEKPLVHLLQAHITGMMVEVVPPLLLRHAWADFSRIGGKI